MNEQARGFDALPDLTHPWDLVHYGTLAFRLLAALAVFALLLGIVSAIRDWAAARGPAPAQAGPGRYEQLLSALHHAFLLLLILTVGFLVCSTLARRYHYWEQARVQRVVESVAGERIEQTAPSVHYLVRTMEDVRTYDYKERKYVTTSKERVDSHYVRLAGSRIQVVLDQFFEPPDQQRAIYRVEYQADHDFQNPLEREEDFYLNASPPAGTSLLQDFKVERDGARLEPESPDTYRFKVHLQPGAQAHFHVSYKAQGGPRWIYDAGGSLLSRFQLTIKANFSSAEFASGILPTSVQSGIGSTTFSWEYKDNVSVKNPFGVFTATARVRNTGILPRLLLLAPGMLAWWLLLQYLTQPLNPRQILVNSLSFFTLVLALAYFSRLVNPVAAWVVLSLAFVYLAWRSAPNERRPATAACAVAGVALPGLGLLLSYTGLTLSLAGLLAAGWLGYGRRDPS